MTKATLCFIMLSLMKTPVIFTTLLIEKSPQALPLGAACVASSVKHTPVLSDACDVKLVTFCKEDADFVSFLKDDDLGPADSTSVIQKSAQYISERLLRVASGFPSAGNGERAAPRAIFCFSVFVWNRLILEATARNLRSKGALCIAGGPEVTAAPESFTDFDRVISGEGEGKVPAVIAELLGIDLARSSTDSAPANDGTQTTTSLDTFPSPYLDGTLDPAEYEGALWELARGCPFKCSYCYESKGEKRVRRFPRARLEAELDLFARKKVPQIFVLDPTYNANKKEAIELLNLIAHKTPDTFYYFEARAEFIDRELARAFTKINCALQIGLQSADENVLRLVNRPFNRKQFVRNIGFLNDAGVIFGLDVIYGLPGDSLRGFKDSVNFAITLYPNNLELFCLSVLPGTDLHDRAASLHLEYEPRPPYHIICTDKFTPEDLVRAEKIAVACSCFYNQGRAVPWFNTILHALHLQAAQFFERFYEWAESNKKEDILRTCCEHKTIEALQKNFVREMLLQKKQNRYVTAALDIISFNGALSRNTDTGVQETLQLSYPAEYIDSQYALDLEFFVNNVKMKKNSFRIF